MTASLRRIFRERRLLVMSLAVALLANAAIFGFIVYPSAGRVAGAEQQERIALQDLAAAQRDHAAALRTQRDKVKAEEDLHRFYTEILPPDMTGARRATYLHLAQLARDAGLQYQRRLEEAREPVTDGQGPAPALARFDITMVLEGDYEGVRQFLRDVEASDGFIVIDNIGLAEGADRSATLVLTVELSTYYRAAGSGS